MVLINLLEWRLQEQQYIYQLKRKLILISCVGAVCMLLIAHVVMQAFIDSASDQLSVVQPQLDKILKTVEFKHDSRKRYSSKNISADIEQVDERGEGTSTQSLNTQQNPHLMLQKLITQPLGDICFTSITRHQNKTVFTGEALSAMHFTQFLLNWELINLFSQININQMTPSVNGKVNISFEAIENDLQ